MKSEFVIIGPVLALSAIAAPVNDTIPIVPSDSDIDPVENATTLPCSTHTAADAMYRYGGSQIGGRWSQFVVHPDIAFNKGELDNILKAMHTIKNIIPCYRFAMHRPNKPPPPGDYVRIAKGTGCSSQVGRHYPGQVITLQSPGCMEQGTIIHELLHALGFIHEHQRADRDHYVTIIDGNIKYPHAVDFEKDQSLVYSSFNGPYNQRSIMHYNSIAHSIDNYSPTMVAKNGQPIGSTGQLQATDIQKLKAMYPCP